MEGLNSSFNLLLFWTSSMTALIGYLPSLVFAAGVGQLVLIVASLAIPRVLHWKEDTARLRPLTRQVFWTYALYIW